MLIRKLVIFAFILSSFSVKGQVCNFCSTEELKNLLIENNIDFEQKYNHSNDIVFIHHNVYFTKNWYIKYDRCYLYEILILNNDKLKPLISIINKHYKRVDECYWEDIDTKVEITTFQNNLTKIQFIPKITFNNLNNN
jgi:hypothetical protein